MEIGRFGARLQWARIRHFPAAMSANPRQRQEARNYTIDVQ
ncbi:hypothetical protein D8I24_1781 [Cupriavidus necator H850]|nr:hypothetical protein D8I24_1781 [Cupriavidus necator H850]